MKSDLFPGLADITFAERDPTAIEASIITGYEKIANRTLAKGDPIRLFLESIAFVIIHQRHLIDFTGKQNLLAYASGDYLAHIGAMLGVARLPPRHAVTTLRFILSEPQPAAVIIPEGTRATPGGGNILFSTTAPLVIPAGQGEGRITAQCDQVGAIGNKLLPGQIKKIVDPFPWQMKVENVTESSGGTDIESDENLRERIQLAPEYFSVAGPRGAYEYWARTAHQGIVDAAVLGPPETEPGHVEIYPLMENGELPTQDILDRVKVVCNAEDIRPLTDFLHVLSPKKILYDLNVTYWIDRSRASQAVFIQKAVKQAVNDWILWQKRRLGRDLNPSELNHRMVAAGAKRVEIVSPTFTVLTAAQVAIPEVEPELLFGGLEDG